MRKIQRLVSVGALAALTVALGACSSEEEPASGAATTTTAPTTSVPAAAASDGVTEISDIAGPACGQVPTEGPGSAAGMVDDPVGTAASNNPLLTTLVAAVTASDLVDTLNNADALTVFAPINPAFEKLAPGVVDGLVSAPNVATPESDLSKILTTHVVGKRYDAAGLDSAGTVMSLQGSTLTLGGTAPDELTVTSGGVTASVVCANVPTANATVFLIDSVMMPAAS